ncbi:MAG: hypothetical protein DWQ56_03940 [Microcystis aeruginosa DA14]|uniref:Uncharacterized protein n=1 Tax=Microcystis aeruginosa DA14 TaxID=1987506 RepID=A0A3E0MKQ6_MICAE|nr:MAG: hypothetical protein DWQ56_03940 [Microcystis aeruginosa DA14]
MAIPIQNTCRLLGEPLSIAEKTDQSHYQLSVISYQLSVHPLLFTEKRLPTSPPPHLPTSPIPHLPNSPPPHLPTSPPPHFPTSPIHNL